jgi:hypothetical protein
MFFHFESNLQDASRKKIVCCFDCLSEHRVGDGIQKSIFLPTTNSKNESPKNETTMTHRTIDTYDAMGALLLLPEDITVSIITTFLPSNEHLPLLFCLAKVTKEPNLFQDLQDPSHYYFPLRKEIDYGKNGKKKNPRRRVTRGEIIEKIEKQLLYTSRPPDSLENKLVVEKHVPYPSLPSDKVVTLRVDTLFTDYEISSGGHHYLNHRNEKRFYRHCQSAENVFLTHSFMMHNLLSSHIHYLSKICTSLKTLFVLDCHESALDHIAGKSLFELAERKQKIVFVCSTDNIGTKNLQNVLDVSLEESDYFSLVFTQSKIFLSNGKHDQFHKPQTLIPFEGDIALKFIQLIDCDEFSEIVLSLIRRAHYQTSIISKDTKTAMISIMMQMKRLTCKHIFWLPEYNFLSKAVVKRYTNDRQRENARGKKHFHISLHPEILRTCYSAKDAQKWINLIDELRAIAHPIHFDIRSAAVANRTMFEYFDTKYPRMADPLEFIRVYSTKHKLNYNLPIFEKWCDQLVEKQYSIEAIEDDWLRNSELKHNGYLHDIKKMVLLIENNEFLLGPLFECLKEDPSTQSDWWADSLVAHEKLWINILSKCMHRTDYQIVNLLKDVAGHHPVDAVVKKIVCDKILLDDDKQPKSYHKLKNDWGGTNILSKKRLHIQLVDDGLIPLETFRSLADEEDVELLLGICTKQTAKQLLDLDYTPTEAPYDKTIWQNERRYVRPNKKRKK